MKNSGTNSIVRFFGLSFPLILLILLFSLLFFSMFNGCKTAQGDIDIPATWGWIQETAELQEQIDNARTQEEKEALKKEMAERMKEAIKGLE